LAIKVTEVELNQPFPSFQDLDLKHYPDLQILVRKNRQCVGYVWIHARNKRFLEEKFIRFEIERQLFDSLNRLELERMLGEGLEPMTRDGVDYDWPSVTIAVCTRGRPASLERALKSLMQLEYPPHRLEVVVIDNAPIDSLTQDVVAKFPQVRYVVEPRPGLDWARNRAIQEANGEIIAYTDDDVEADSLWVQALAGHFANPEVMCITGLVAPAELETEAQKLFEDYGGFGRGFHMRYYTMGLRERWPYWPLAAGNFGTGCNMAYRKSLFDKIGGFDEALDVGTPSSGAGDHDMFYRTLRAGYLLVYEPQALIWHYHRRELTKLRDQLADFGRGVYAYWTKTFLTDREMRWQTFRFATSWYRQWFIKRLRKKRRFPRDLVWAEAKGALQGPIVYLRARRQARRIAHQFPKVEETGLQTGISLNNSQSVFIASPPKTQTLETRNLDRRA
jgi:glycosyltransferase involved in cell wall biosynthesis